MKSYNHLFEELISYDNLYLAIINSSKRKKKRKDVKKVLENPTKYIKIIQEMLINRTFEPQKHPAIQIYDGSSRKLRLIIQPKYLYEQIIHHAVIQVLKPIFMKGMYPFSCGSIPKRGGHYGKRHIEKFIRENKDNNELKYVLKLDIHHYYKSIDINILKEKFKRTIHDAKFLYVINTILDSNIAIYEGKEISMGLPIGFYTSQWFANWLLQKLDHYIKEQLHIKCYVRYVDDMILFYKNKRELHKHFKLIRLHLENIDLNVKSNWQVFKFNYKNKKEKEIGRPLDFMGFKFYRNKTILRKSIMFKAIRKANKISKKDKINWYEASQILSYVGWFKSTNTYNTFKKYIKYPINLCFCKELIRNRNKCLNRQINYLIV